MLEPGDLCEAVIGFFQPKLLAGRRIVMTAGPTFESIDPGARHHQFQFRQDGLWRLAGRARRRGRRHAGERTGGAAGAGGCARGCASASRCVRRCWQAVPGSDVFHRRGGGGGLPPGERGGTQDQKSIGASWRSPDAQPRHPRRGRGAAESAVLRRFCGESRNLDEYAEGVRKAKAADGDRQPGAGRPLGSDDNQVVLFDDAAGIPLPRAPKPSAVAGPSSPIWRPCCPPGTDPLLSRDQAMHRIDMRILDDRLKSQPPAYATSGSAGLDLRACVTRRWC